MQLETVQLGLQSDPSNAELRTLKSELEEAISLTQAAIAELRPAAAAATPSKTAPKNPVTSPSAPPKWSKESHPAYRTASISESAPPPPAPSTHAHSTFAVNDTVLAKWVSGDNSFYPARITSITGSSSSPVYIVTFKSYATTETLSAKDIKPMSNNSHADLSRKRKSPPPSSSGANSTTITASPSIDPTLAAQSRSVIESARASDGTTRAPKAARKVKATKELESSKSKWQDFAAKGAGAKKGGPLKKDSMFRTPEGVHGRVGFTGSGQQMRKDKGRSRHVYERAGEDDI